MGTPGLISKRCSAPTRTPANDSARTAPNSAAASAAPGRRPGVWCLQLELPPPTVHHAGRSAAPGSTCQEAQTVLDEVRTLLALAPKDRDLTLRIARLLSDLPARRPIPTPETVAKTLRAGHIDGVTATVGACLDDWLHARNGLAEGTVKFYADHIRNHLTPHLGNSASTPSDPSTSRTCPPPSRTRPKDLDARASPDPKLRASVRGKRPAGRHRTPDPRLPPQKRQRRDRVYRLIEYNPAIAMRCLRRPPPRPGRELKAVAAGETPARPRVR